MFNEGDELLSRKLILPKYSEFSVDEAEDVSAVMTVCKTPSLITSKLLSLLFLLGEKGTFFDILFGIE
jgi:hypothetical protein